MPSGVNKELEGKITLGFAAENVILGSCLILFNKQTDLLLIKGISKDLEIDKEILQGNLLMTNNHEQKYHHLGIYCSWWLLAPTWVLLKLDVTTELFKKKSD